MCGDRFASVVGRDADIEIEAWMSGCDPLTTREITCVHSNLVDQRRITGEFHRTVKAAMELRRNFVFLYPLR